MMKLRQKVFSIAGLSTFITLLMSAGIAQAIPPCYMVNQAGQTVDLSYMCNANSDRIQPQETEQEERTFSRRIPVNNQTSQEPIRTYADVYKYVNSEEDQEYAWNDFQYYNRFLEFPSANVSRRVTRQEISPRVVRYSREVLVNPDGSEVVLTNRNSSQISRQMVIGPYGFPESIFVDYSQIPSGSFQPTYFQGSYSPTPRGQLTGSVYSGPSGSSSNVLTNFLR
ncbi:MAG: hypothetical protein QNJ37_10580 [Crocosphaera sp.]|nr:hypothetical protein [Crocosphaera sp.]